MDFLKELFSKLGDINALVRWAGYSGMFAIVFSETGLLVGFFLPGDSLLFTAGLFAARGDFNIVYLNLLLWVAAISGNSSGYYIGKKGGQALYNRPESRWFKREHLLKTKEFYEKYGGITIVMAQFMPFARTFAPVVAGIGEMGYTRFMSFNVGGAILWITSMTCLGYFLGTIIPNIDKYIIPIIGLIVLLSVSPGIIKYLQVKFSKKP
jgi:membrane-associated protein